MSREYAGIARVNESVLQTNSVIRNTYILLSLSLLFSAAMAMVAMFTGAPSMGVGTLLLYFGFMALIHVFRNSALGILFVFCLTGVMGFSLGPMLNLYIQGFSNGTQLVMTALGGTGLIFFALSGYALTTRKDFSFMTGFLFAGMMVALVGIVISLFIPMPILHIGISCLVMLMSAGFILHETSAIIHGGQTNYVLATVQLYVSLFNLFVHLLQFLAMFAGRRD